MFRPLKKILERSVDKNQFLGAKIQEARAVLSCQQVVEEDLAQELKINCRAVSFRAGTIELRVANSVLAQEVRARGQDLIKKANKRLGKDALKKILIRVE